LRDAAGLWLENALDREDWCLMKTARRGVSSGILTWA
jgi:hypothetical protein